MAAKVLFTIKLIGCDWSGHASAVAVDDSDQSSTPRGAMESHRTFSATRFMLLPYSNTAANKAVSIL